MANNPKYFGQSTTGTPNQIEDGVDFPHTGLLKALSTASSGRYAVSGFDISGETATAITVAAGKIMYNNFLLDVNGATLNLSTSHSNGYHLLVAPKPTGLAPNYASPTVVLRNPSAADKVAEYTLGDTIIGVVTHTGTTNAKVQFLTYDKTENSLSLAHHNSAATYTEMGKLYATSTGIVIEQDSATNLGNIQIKNTDQDKDIIFTMDDGGVEKSITLNADIATAQFGDFSITTNGSVTANGVALTGGGVVSNHGDNRIVTSGAANTNLNGESNLTFDGNNLGVTGTITSTGLITTTANNITAPAGSVSAVSIGAGTNGISNAGKYTQSQELAADALGGHGITTHGHVEVLAALTPVNLINPIKEHYYVGLDTQSQATHNAGIPISPTGIDPLSQYGLLTKANEVNRAAGNLTTHTYAADDVFGGNTFFVALQKPETCIGRTVSITNITSFYLYVLVGNQEAGDPSQFAERRRINGGVFDSSHALGGLKQIGNTRCINMSSVLLGNSQFYPVASSMQGKDLDAILVKPRETITLSALEITGETPGTHQNDVFNEQGLWNFPTGPSGLTGMWFLKSASSSGGFANVVNVVDGNIHVPVAMTGTTFICTGTTNFMLPNNPPIGTQYSFLVKQGTTTLDRPDVTTEAHMIHLNSPQDEFYELSASSATAPLSVTAGNGKTVIYTESRNWEVIG